MRIELAYLWLTLKDELSVLLLPARLHQYFVELYSTADAYKAHANRLKSAIRTISLTGLLSSPYPHRR